MSDRPRQRTLRTMTVTGTRWLSPGMVRVALSGPDLGSLPELPYTDQYLKLVFAPPAAPYEWPFDSQAVQEAHPPELWPVTRTYTIRRFDRTTGELTIDFVVHGHEGLAGPWAAQAQPGQSIGAYGPGGRVL